MKSPFKAPTATRLMGGKYGGKLVIRVDDASPTDRIIVSTDPNVMVSAASANFYLNGGESIEISGASISDRSAISVLATAGTPDIYVGET